MLLHAQLSLLGLHTHGERVSPYPVSLIRLSNEAFTMASWCQPSNICMAPLLITTDARLGPPHRAGTQRKSNTHKLARRIPFFISYTADTRSALASCMHCLYSTRDRSRIYHVYACIIYVYRSTMFGELDS